MLMNSRSTNCLGLTVLAAIMVASSPQAGAMETLVDDARGFSLTLPDGLVPAPDLVGASPDIVHGFVLGDPTDDEVDIMLFIEEMHGTIGRERLKVEDLPPGFEGRVFTTSWGGFEVDAFEVPEQLGEIEVITFNVQIPLKRSAIQVKLFGPADRKAELKKLLSRTLAGLEGESNWIQSAVPLSPVASSRNYGTILLAFAIALILGGLIVLWLVSRSAPRGTVLVIAAAIYFAGMALEGIRVREVLMLAGALKMLGFAGGMLGIVDLVRKREPRERKTM